MIKKLSGAPKTVLGAKFVVIQSYFRKPEEISNKQPNFTT